ncbi:MAG: hypothetical protein ACLVD9_09915 [Ruminococcus sp.]|uniref:hypothetical protein n=1 Tax=Ruminococcus sp. TaxID=41978 RepID=UPI00399A75A0
MLLKIKTLFSKKNIKKLLLSSLCFLLCIMTVICFGGVLAPVQANAVTGVEEIIMFVIGIMVACGVTFTSAEAAQSTARRYYNSVDSDTKSIIDKAKEQYDAKKEYYTVTTNGLIMCLASEWQKIFDSIASFIFNPSVIADSSYVDFSVPQATFKNYDSFVSLLQQNGSLDFDYQVTRDSYTAFTIGSTMIEFVGQDRTGNFPDEVISAFSSNTHNVIMKVSILGTQYSFYSLISSQPYMLNYIKYYDYQYQFTLKDSVINLGYRTSSNLGYSYRSLIAGLDFSQPVTLMYYGSELLNVTSIEGHRYTITGSFGNIVCDDGTILGTDYLIPCDSNKITDDILTKVFTCDPAISIGNDYIGTDTTWSDSIADAGSGSIAFPLDVDDLIDLSPSDVRDKTLTDTGDIATDKTDTKDDTKDDTKEDPNTKPNKPSIPGLSLPEILFKEKFPFCLPWDVYNVFANLVAEPEAPVFEIPMKWEFLDIDYTLTIDFSMFDEIAKISRFFSSLGFVVFLILISRKVIGAE